MFDFAWSEIALVGIVALILIGPKDLPIAIRAVTDVIKKMRRMAGELQTHVDDMVRDADLQEARDTFRDLKSMNIRGQVMRAVDSDGALRKTLTEKPLAGQDLLRPTPAYAATAVPAPISLANIPPPDAAPPAFVPPSAARPGAPVTAGPLSPPPAFIPPSSAARQHAPADPDPAS